MRSLMNELVLGFGGSVYQTSADMWFGEHGL